MADKKPVIYVLAGPNGIGKTTVNSLIVPAQMPFVNADDIAKQLRERLGNTQTQELANAAAVERMNQFIAQKADFAIETNLADNETWLFLNNIQRIGYSVYLYFFCTSEVEICIDRVAMRYKQGGHFVRPDVVKLRYENGLKLLQYYKNSPDRLFLTDNSATVQQLCLEMQQGEIVYQAENLPAWVEYILKETSISRKTSDADIATIRQKYQQMRGKSEKD